MNAMYISIVSIELEKLDCIYKDMEENSNDADKLYMLYIEKDELEYSLLESYEDLEILK